MTHSGYVANSQSVCNYPVQSLATADIIPIAIIYLWHGMRDMQSFINNTVHDSVGMEVHPDEVDKLRELSVDCFTNKVYTYLHKVYGIYFNVPLGTGFKLGSHWGTGKEVVQSVEPPPIEELR